MSNPLLPLMYGPAGRALVVDASGRLVINGDSGSDRYIFGYGCTGRTMTADASGRLMVSALSVGLGADYTLRTWFENASGVWTDNIASNYLDFTNASGNWVKDGENLGGGVGVFSAKDADANLEFNSLVGGSGVIVSSSGNTVRFDSSVTLQDAYNNDPTIDVSDGPITLTGGTGTDIQGDNWSISSSGVLSVATMIEADPEYIVYDSGEMNSNTLAARSLSHGAGVEGDGWDFFVTESLALYGYTATAGTVNAIGPWRSYNMGSKITTSRAGYNQLNDTSVDSNDVQTVSCWAMADWSNTVSCYSNYSNVRFKGIKIPGSADIYDSGWTEMFQDTMSTFAHGLSSLPNFVVVEMSENSDGTGWRVPVMSSMMWNGDAWAQSCMIACDDTNIKVRNKVYVCSFRSFAGAAVSPTSGWLRVKATNWAPHFQTDWTAIDTANNQNQIVEHDLGKEPSLAFLELSEGPDGSGWHVIGMDSIVTNYNTGTTISNMNEKNVWINGGNTYLCNIYDEDDSVAQPTEGYFRLSVWR